MDYGFWDTVHLTVGVRNRTAALIAVVNEFGSYAAGVPERPFFRLANERIKRGLRGRVRAEVRAAGGAMTVVGAERIGEWAAGLVSRSAVWLKTPPNAPSTIRKKGSSNPLVDYGLLVRSVQHEVKYTLD